MWTSSRASPSVHWIGVSTIVTLSCLVAARLSKSTRNTSVSSEFVFVVCSYDWIWSQVYDHNYGSDSKSRFLFCALQYQVCTCIRVYFFVGVVAFWFPADHSSQIFFSILRWWYRNSTWFKRYTAWAERCGCKIQLDQITLATVSTTLSGNSDKSEWYHALMLSKILLSATVSISEHDKPCQINWGPGCTRTSTHEGYAREDCYGQVETYQQLTFNVKPSTVTVRLRKDFRQIIYDPSLYINPRSIDCKKSQFHCMQGAILSLRMRKHKMCEATVFDNQFQTVM